MTLKEAKTIYLKYDCSLFAMAREEKMVYETYKLLNIPSSVEEKWRQEWIGILMEQLKKSGSCELFNKIEDILEDCHNKKNLFVLKKALDYVIFENSEMKASVAETMLGRKDLSARSGMIFWAYDIGEHGIAKELLQFVINLLTNQSVDEEISSRFERSIRTANMINSELKLCDVTFELGNIESNTVKQ